MKARAGSRQAEFEKTMVPFMDQLYSYAYYLTGDRDQAGDLLQETYLKAYRFFDSFAEGTNAKAWLYRIMRNTSINEYRKIKRLPELLRFDEQITPIRMIAGPSGGTDDLRKLIEERSFGDEVSGAIAGLPEKFKSVIVLRDIEDLPYEEVAAVLDIPVGTVRSRLHRARALLFDRLENYARKNGYAVVREAPQQEYAMAG